MASNCFSIKNVARNAALRLMKISSRLLFFLLRTVRNVFFVGNFHLIARQRRASD